MTNFEPDGPGISYVGRKFPINRSHHQLYTLQEVDSLPSCGTVPPPRVGTVTASPLFSGQKTRRNRANRIRPARLEQSLNRMYTLDENWQADWWRLVYGVRVLLSSLAVPSDRRRINLFNRLNQLCVIKN